MNNKTRSQIKSVLAGISHEKAILFGSRASGTARKDSDYDILLILKENNVSAREKIRLATKIRKELAGMGIDADVLIRTHEEAEYYRKKIGSVTKAALEKGVAI